MSAHRSTTKIDSVKAGAKKAGHGLLKGTEVFLEAVHRAGLRAEAERAEEEAKEAYRKVGENPGFFGFFGGLGDAMAADERAKAARARYDEAVNGKAS